MSTLTIARLTFREARQRKLLWIGALLGLAFLGLFAIGFFFMHRDMSRGGGTTLFEISSGFVIVALYVVNFLAIVVAVIVSVDTIAGEISSGTIQTVVTKPLRRWEVVLGKWLGLAGMLSLFIAGMSAGIMAIAWAIAHYLPPNPVQGVAMMVMGGLVVLTLSILGGTRLSTMANGVAVLMLYGLAFIAGWIEQIGAFTRNAAAVNTGIVVSLLMPGEAMWKRAAYVMQPSYMRELGVSPFASASAPSQAMVLYAAIYIAVALAAATHLFQNRDL